MDPINPQNVTTDYLISSSNTSTMDLSTVMASKTLQEDYLENRLAMWIWRYLAPVLIILGTTGNCGCFIILRSRSFRESSIAFTLSALAVIDTGVLYTSLLRQWIIYLTGDEYDVRYLLGVSGCKLHMFLTYYLVHLSAWTLVVVTGERALTVSLPFVAKIACSKARVATFWTAIAIILFVVNLHFFFTVTYLEGKVPVYGSSDNSTMEYRRVCGPSEDYQWFFNDVWYTMDLFILALIPFVLILAGNLVITICVLKAIEFRRRHQMAAVSSQTSPNGTYELMSIQSQGYAIRNPTLNQKNRVNNCIKESGIQHRYSKNLLEGPKRSPEIGERCAPLAMTESSSAEEIQNSLATPQIQSTGAANCCKDLNKISEKTTPSKNKYIKQGNASPVDPAEKELQDAILMYINSENSAAHSPISNSFKSLKCLKRLKLHLRPRCFCKSRRKLDRNRSSHYSHHHHHHHGHHHYTFRNHPMVLPNFSEAFMSTTTTSSVSNWRDTRSNVTPRTGSQRRSRPLTSSTTMLLGISAMFLLTTVPSAVFFMYVDRWIIAAEKDLHSHAQIRLTFAITNIIYYLNNAVNFLLYCLTGSRFRRALMDWMRQRRKSMMDLRLNAGQEVGRGAP